MCPPPDSLYLPMLIEGIAFGEVRISCWLALGCVSEKTTPADRFILYAVSFIEQWKTEWIPVCRLHN